MSKEITGALFKQMILHGAAAITAQKQAINDLNVFPVPDGDTGTNMSMTIATAAEALRTTDETVLTIASRCGFENLSYFNRAFKAHFGMTPRDYRKK